MSNPFAALDPEFNVLQIKKNIKPVTSTKKTQSVPQCNNEHKYGFCKFHPFLGGTCKFLHTIVPLCPATKNGEICQNQQPSLNSTETVCKCRHDDYRVSNFKNFKSLRSAKMPITVPVRDQCDDGIFCKKTRGTGFGECPCSHPVIRSGAQIGANGDIRYASEIQSFFQPQTNVPLSVVADTLKTEPSEAFVVIPIQREFAPLKEVMVITPKPKNGSKIRVNFADIATTLS
jgi:hypothetical protein